MTVTFARALDIAGDACGREGRESFNVCGRDEVVTPKNVSTRFSSGLRISLTTDRTWLGTVRVVKV